MLDYLRTRKLHRVLSATVGTQISNSVPLLTKETIQYETPFSGDTCNQLPWSDFLIASVSAFRVRKIVFSCVHKVFTVDISSSSRTLHQSSLYYSSIPAVFHIFNIRSAAYIPCSSLCEMSRLYITLLFWCCSCCLGSQRVLYLRPCGFDVALLGLFRPSASSALYTTYLRTGAPPCSSPSCRCTGFSSYS